MKNYEIMFIVRTDVDEATVKCTAQSLEKVLTDHKAKITLSKELGQKEFADEIKNFIGDSVKKILDNLIDINVIENI